MDQRSVGRRLFFAIIVQLVALTAPIPCNGALIWDSLQSKQTIWSGDKEAAATFRCTNSGTSPIAIISVQTSCNCITTVVSEKSIAPGQSGEIKAILEIGERTGQVVKLITVTTDDRASKSTTLLLQVDIKQFIVCTPQFVYWKAGESKLPKQVDVVNSTEMTMASMTAVSADKRLTTRMEQIIPGKQFRLWITPSSTSASFVAAVSCQPTIDGSHPPPSIVFAAVVK
jgi:hypothetical protein